jgi:hypothetical protein
MSTPEKSDLKKIDKNVIKLDPITLAAILLGLLFLPLVFSGFFAH